jgi:hypothetical protein
VTRLPGNERNSVWRSPTVMGLSLITATRRLDAAEVTRASPSAPWGEPKVFAPDHFLDSPLPDGLGYVASGPDGLYRLIPGAPATALVTDPRLGFSSAVIPRPGHTLFFEGFDSTGSEFIGARDLPSGPIRRVIEFPDRPIGVRTFDTDGSRFFFTIGQHQADIWVADVTAQ